MQKFLENICERKLKDFLRNWFYTKKASVFGLRLGTTNINKNWLASMKDQGKKIFHHFIYINDVTIFGGGGKYFCDDSTKPQLIKHVATGEGSVKNCPEVRDVIHIWT